MTRTPGGTRLVLLALSALLLPVVAFVAPARAADPAPIATTVRFFHTSGPAPESRFYLNARARAADGSVPRGTVTFFRVGESAPLAGPVAVDGTGLATAELTTNVGPITGDPLFEVRFAGASGYADSAALDNAGGGLVAHPEPTILTLGGPGLLKLSLTTAAQVFREDGLPAEGAKVTFTLRAPAAEMAGGQLVCSTQVDRNGLASCKGQGLLAALLSILATGVYATAYDDFGNFRVVQLPVVATG